MPQTVTLCLTSPLAQQLRHSEAARQRALKAQVWQTPEIFPVDEWVRRLWLTSWPMEQQLHPAQELRICEEIVTKDDSVHVLSRIELARAVRRSIALVDRYDLPLQDGGELNDEVSRLRAWYGQFHARVKELGGASNASVEALAAQAIRDGVAALPEAITFVGDLADLNPQQRAVLTAAEEAGCPVTVSALPAFPEPAAVTQSTLRDEADMWNHVALICRDILQRAEERAPRIVIGVLNEEGSRARIESALQENLTPDIGPEPRASRYEVPWSFMHGERLARYSLVSTALTLMEMTVDCSDGPQFSALLRNPMIFSGRLTAPAAMLDVQIRRDGGDKVTWSRLISRSETLKTISAADREALTTRLTALRDALAEAPFSATPSQWLDLLDGYLRIIGWPAVEGRIDSATHQELEKWRDACGEFVSLDSQVKKIVRPTAARYLREVMSTRRFAPHADVEKPIEILPLDQMMGVCADHIILAGLTDTAFPLPVSKDPFLPQAMLVERDVHLSSPELAHAYSVRLVEAIRHQARAVHCVFPRHSEAGAESRPSPALATLLEGASDAKPLAKTTWECLSDCRPTLVSTDEVFVPLGDEERRRLTGGVDLLKTAAVTPWLTFVRHRLGLSPLESFERISARTQGTMTHAILEGLFKDYPSQEALLEAQNAGTLDGAIHALTTAVVNARLPLSHYRPAVVQIERDRQFAVVLAWVTHELRRADPFTVIAREKRVKIDFHGLPMELILDRVDRVHTPDGPRDLLIDYKTGKTSPSGWDTAALREPQLPLYGTPEVLKSLTEAVAPLDASVGNIGCDGVCFSEVNETQPKFKALTNWTPRLLVDGRKDARTHIQDWPGRQAQWAERLESLAQAVQDGSLVFADVTEKDFMYTPELTALAQAGEAPGTPILKHGGELFGALTDDNEDNA